MRLAPGIEAVETLLVFSDSAQVFPVHVNAIGAAVNLRGAQFNKMEKRSLEAGLVKISFKPQHGLVYAGSNFGCVDSRLHGSSCFDGLAAWIRGEGCATSDFWRAKCVEKFIWRTRRSSRLSSLRVSEPSASVRHRFQESNAHHPPLR